MTPTTCDDIYYAWYSYKQERMRSQQENIEYNYDNSCKYKITTKREKTPRCVYWINMDNKQVETTMVTKTKKHNCNTIILDDLNFLGKVKKFGGVCRW